jgi:hypothetical protein
MKPLSSVVPLEYVTSLLSVLGSGGAGGPAASAAVVEGSPSLP